MKRITILGLCLAATLAISAMATSTSSAYTSSARLDWKVNGKFLSPGPVPPQESSKPVSGTFQFQLVTFVKGDKLVVECAMTTTSIFSGGLPGSAKVEKVTLSNCKAKQPENCAISAATAEALPWQTTLEKGLQSTDRFAITLATRDTAPPCELGGEEVAGQTFTISNVGSDFVLYENVGGSLKVEEQDLPRFARAEPFEVLNEEGAISFIGEYSVNPGTVEVGEPAQPKWYKGSVVLKANVPLRTISYGRLTLSNEHGGAVECANAVGGTVEQAGTGEEFAGQQVTEGWVAYQCKEKACEEGGGIIHVLFENENAPGPAFQLDWPGDLVTAEGEIRLVSSNIRVTVDCQHGQEPASEAAAPPPNEPLDTRTSTELIAPGVTAVCTTEAPGRSEATMMPKEGWKFTQPGKSEFFGSSGPSKNELNCGTAGKAFTTGRLTNYGYTETNGVPSLVEAKLR